MGRVEPVADEVVEACAQTLLRRIEARMAKDEERAERLRGLAREAARRIAMRLGATRVWLFGSLAWGSPHGRSDVDLLVEGIAGAAWLDASGIAEEVVGGPCDVIRSEEADPQLVARVRAEGVLLHDAS